MGDNCALRSTGALVPTEREERSAEALPETATGGGPAGRSIAPAGTTHRACNPRFEPSTRATRADEPLTDTAPEMACAAASFMRSRAPSGTASRSTEEARSGRAPCVLSTSRLTPRGSSSTAASSNVQLAKRGNAPRSMEWLALADAPLRRGLRRRSCVPRGKATSVTRSKSSPCSPSPPSVHTRRQSLSSPPSSSGPRVAVCCALGATATRSCCCSGPRSTNTEAATPRYSTWRAARATPPLTPPRRIADQHGAAPIDLPVYSGSYAGDGTGTRWVILPHRIPTSQRRYTPTPTQRLSQLAYLLTVKHHAWDRSVHRLRLLFVALRDRLTHVCLCVLGELYSYKLVL